MNSSGLWNLECRAFRAFYLMRDTLNSINHKCILFNHLIIWYTPCLRNQQCSTAQARMKHRLSPRQSAPLDSRTWAYPWRILFILIMHSEYYIVCHWWGFCFSLFYNVANFYIVLHATCLGKTLWNTVQNTV